MAEIRCDCLTDDPYDCAAIKNGFDDFDAEELECCDCPCHDPWYDDFWDRNYKQHECKDGIL